MGQHTLGPWKAKGGRIVAGHDAIPGAIAHTGPSLTDHANARLIAKAPEMLKFVHLVAIFFGRDGEEARALLREIDGA